ncbi:DUF4145 domain-containing protein [Methylovulum psychrotolerans]|uniref:DUF4145 domain-containing protein n=1 Tax=Methylovulum psychrotolerans TaxID=1704499 RepID=UPI001BFF4846|nr:DUF4145 domain-containing protein [Methylovulum psychrotolerans]MBT9100466.1 DUF4145 domain-containing protein [Methylovulum psychrotolerans]
MSGFNNQTFRYLVKDLLNDAFYVNGRASRGVIATIRQYSEVIVRKILNLSENEFVTLGKKEIVNKIKIQSNNNLLLLNALDKIKGIGNDCTHTQKTEKISKQDMQDTIDNLYDLYAYLFIYHFEKHKFGSNNEIISAFSILPPIIRYITLKYLYDNDCNNLDIIDKLSLATLKAFDKNKAQEWLDERKDKLLNMPSVTKVGALNLQNKYGKEKADIVVKNALNMYDLCSDKIKSVASVINEKGNLYDSFESAIALYQNKGIVTGSTADVIEFNSLMEFVYLGRRDCSNERLQNKEAYIIMN